MRKLERLRTKVDRGHAENKRLISQDDSFQNGLCNSKFMTTQVKKGGQTWSRYHPGIVSTTFFFLAAALPEALRCSVRAPAGGGKQLEMLLHLPPLLLPSILPFFFPSFLSECFLPRVLSCVCSIGTSHPRSEHSAERTVFQPAAGPGPGKPKKKERKRERIKKSEKQQK